MGRAFTCIYMQMCFAARDPARRPKCACSVTFRAVTSCFLLECSLVFVAAMSMKSEFPFNSTRLTLGERFLMFAWIITGAVWLVTKTTCVWTDCVSDTILYLATGLAAAVALMIDVWRQEKRTFIVSLVMLTGTMNGLGCLQRLMGLNRVLPFAVAAGVLCWLIAVNWPFHSFNTRKATYVRIAACLVLTLALSATLSRYLAGESFLR
jgi:hypothetical protein